MAGIDLDVLLGENKPRPLTYKSTQFDLPGELPAAALAPFLATDLGLIDLVTDVLESEDTHPDEGYLELALRVLKARPTLPLDLLLAAKAALSELLGDRAEEFYALKPSVPAYWALASNLTKEYGFDISDFFESDDSSETGGASSKETSNSTTASTPEVSGDAPETPVSSESDASGS